MGSYSLFAAIILWGTLLGGIAYSHIVYFPPYLSDLPNSAVIVNGKYGLHEGNFWLLIHPLLILSLIITLAFNWKYKERRNLMLTSFGIYIVVLIVSNVYLFLSWVLSGKVPNRTYRRQNGSRAAIAGNILAGFAARSVI